MRFRGLRGAMTAALLMAGGISLFLLTLWSPLLSSPILQRAALLAAGALMGSAIVGAYWLRRRVNGSMDGLVGLVHAYGDRRFAEPCAIPIQREFEPLKVALIEMAEKLGRDEKELIRRERLEGALSRFFPPTQAAEIANGQRPLDLNGQRRVISVVFVRVAGYGGFVKTAPPTKVVALLQEVYGLVSEICFRQGGVMDKSLGDCMVALFGAHELQADHARRALAASEDLCRFMEANAPLWKQLHSFSAELAIGVSSGEAIVGDLGGEAGIEYTALGDVVSTAARLAAMARPGQVLVSSEVTDYLPESRGFELHAVSEQPLWESGPPIKVLELAEV